MREVELITNDIFKDITFNNEEIPMDIIEFFEDAEKTEKKVVSGKAKEPFIRKSVIQRAISAPQTQKSVPQILQHREKVEKQVDEKTKESNKNAQQIMECQQLSEARRKLLLNLLSCPRCNFVFQSPEEKNDHINCLGKPLVHSCLLRCVKEFSSFSELCEHICTTHRLNVNKSAKKLFPKPIKMQDPVNCRLCQIQLVSAAALQSHFKFEHPEELPYACSICGHTTHEEIRFKRHMLCHSSEMPREYCNICFKQFRNKVSLRTHRNMVHKLGKKYTCAYCGKILYSSQYLKKHESTHTGQKFKGVVCKFCGKTVEYTKLKNHELTHTGEKPFKCSDCDYRCIQRSNLRIHMKGIHKKELPRLYEPHMMSIL